MLSVIGKHDFSKSWPSWGLTPRRCFWRPFQPLSLAKHIQALLLKRLCAYPKLGSILEDSGSEPAEELDKTFGYAKNFRAKYKLVKKLGRGFMGHVFYARGKKGELKDQPVAVKIIPKANIKSETFIEDVQREVKILKALSGRKHLLKFYDAFEDDNNVDIVMELCEGGDLWDRIFERKLRRERYTEEEIKVIVKQILSAVSFCHLQGIVHRDLKPENIMFASGGEDAEIKLIDFGVSEIIKQVGERFDDIVGTDVYTAPEVLSESYSLEADLWSIGVITYYLIGGNYPFWADTKKGIYRLVKRSDPKFEDEPWPSVSPEAKDFIKRLLYKNQHKRMTAAEALAHRWLSDESYPLPLDFCIYRFVKIYLNETPLGCAARKALSKALTADQLGYLRAQFRLLEPNSDGSVSLENFEKALARNATEIMDESYVPEIVSEMGWLADRKMYFEEFCAAAIHILHLEADGGWKQIVSAAFEHFEQEGNRVISNEEFCEELCITGPSALSSVQDCIRDSDGKLNGKYMQHKEIKAAMSIKISAMALSSRYPSNSFGMNIPTSRERLFLSFSLLYTELVEPICSYGLRKAILQAHAGGGGFGKSVENSFNAENFNVSPANVVESGERVVVNFTNCSLDIEPLNIEGDLAGEKGNDKLIRDDVNVGRVYVEKGMEVPDTSIGPNSQFLEELEEAVQEENMELIGPFSNKGQLIVHGNEREEQVNIELVEPICSNGLKGSDGLPLTKKFSKQNGCDKAEYSHQLNEEASKNKVNDTRKFRNLKDIEEEIEEDWFSNLLEKTKKRSKRLDKKKSKKSKSKNSKHQSGEAVNDSFIDSDFENRNRSLMKEAQATWEVGKMLGISFDCEESLILEKFKSMEKENDI
ncbi:hypothetical protein CCACVL1_23674 [Corchorus capsularis]|uniref:non-specific serine/threonine protein kinase n=1 Tax=Corchorus capsularis TaxID=210143 RepID=A0A1R3GT32_COCAP|nr:hypothetical protein CCACVL1_23674 [Corchorus capsularis]